jgi:hypothetical protein
MGLPPTPLPTSPTTQSVDDAANQVVVLAFDFVGQELADLPTQLQNAMQDPKVKEAISTALTTFVSQRAAAGSSTTNMSAKDAADLLKALQSAAGTPLTDAATQQIKNSPQYKKLEQAFKSFETAAKTSPMGVWIDRHSGLLIVVGLALVVGGSAALYVTKTGGATIDFAFSQVVGKPLQIFRVGTLTVSGQVLAFQPGIRTLGGGLDVTKKWDKVAVTLKVGVVAAGPQVQKVQGAVVVKTPDANVSITGTGDPSQRKYNFGVSLEVEKGPAANLKIGVGAIVTGDKVTGGSVTGGMKTRVGDFGLSGQTDNRDVRALATWTLTF